MFRLHETNTNEKLQRKKKNGNNILNQAMSSLLRNLVSLCKLKTIPGI